MREETEGAEKDEVEGAKIVFMVDTYKTDSEPVMRSEKTLTESSVNKECTISIKAIKTLKQTRKLIFIWNQNIHNLCI